MIETLIFSYIKPFSLIRELAGSNVNTLGYRVLNNKELVSYISQKVASYTDKKVVNNKEKAYIYNFFISKSEYFKGATYEDAKLLSETVDSIRELIEEDEEKVLKDKLQNSKESKEKYEAIYDIYLKYVKYLKDNNLTDLIFEERRLLSLNNKLNNEISVLKEEDISPLTLKLLNNTFNKVNQICFIDLFKEKEKPILYKDNLFKTKGFSHEVSNVFKIIHENKFPFDTCTIVCTKLSNFYNAIIELSKTFNIPVSFVDGVLATKYNVYRLLYLIVKHNDNLYGYDSLKELLSDYSFDFEKFVKDIDIKNDVHKFIRVIGDLKFSFNKKQNDIIFNNYSNSSRYYINEVEKYKNILNEGLINFLDKYTVIDDEPIKDSLIKDIKLYKDINGDVDFEFLRSLYNKNITTTYSKEGRIAVCSLSRAKENLRDNMFFIGNDSESFHITLAENTFISDDKLVEISPKYAKTSVLIAENKKKEYIDTIKICASLGLNCYFSYTELDEIELKKHNFISILYILFKDVDNSLTFDNFKDMFKVVNGYTQNGHRKDEKIIQNYLDKTIEIKTNNIKEEEEKKIEGLLDKEYSPTAIEEGLNCKRKFLISKILRVASLDEYDVFRKFENNDFGNMFHDCMEFANDKSKTEKEVLKQAEYIFDKKCSQRNPLLKYELEKDKEDFLRLVKNGYHYLHAKPQGETENEINKDITFGSNILHIKGRPDLVVDDAIIDYKAKTHITHFDEDKLSCIQALIYALLRDDKPITHVEYYYPYFRKTIQTSYAEADVKAILNSFVDTLINSDFTPAYLDEEYNKDVCAFCDFNDVCGKEDHDK